MSDSQQILRRAYFDIEASSSCIPLEYQLSADIAQLPSKVIPTPSVGKELEWISQYSDQDKDLPASKSAINAMIAENSATPVPVTNPVLTQDQLIEKMMQKTEQDRNICFFFLESVNWDLDQAIEMLNNLQTT